MTEVAAKDGAPLRRWPVWVRTPKRSETWKAWEADFRNAALECCIMLEADIEAQRLAESILASRRLDKQARCYARLEELVARKMHALMKARESGPRRHLSKPAITPLAFVCPNRRLLRVNVVLAWRGQTVRQSIEATLPDLSGNSEAE